MLLSLESNDDVVLLEKASRDPDLLLERLVSGIKTAADGDDARLRQALKRLRASGRITLLIDGLDHAISHAVPAKLSLLLNSMQWKNCPAWIAGRPYAFDLGWSLFEQPEWEFLRVESLREPEVRLYLMRHAGGDWYDLMPGESRNLLANPRLLGLIAGILKGAVQEADDASRDRQEAIQALDLRTAADVYALAYFTLGKYVDPAQTIPDRDDVVNRRGLIASGLKDAAAWIGLKAGEEPDRTNYQQRIDRTGTLLGAIAFEMFVQNTFRTAPDKLDPAPNTIGVPEKEMEAFKKSVKKRLQASDPEGEFHFSKDFKLLTEMNTRTVDFLLFRELGQRGIAWHDRTVQAFFAAYWAMTFGAAHELETIRDKWIIDPKGDRLDAFDEFWQFAAEMPDALVNTGKWHGVFKPCYALPKELARLPQAEVQWRRKMIYHSFERMAERSRPTIDDWRGLWLQLESNGGTVEQCKIYETITGGFRRCPKDPSLIAAQRFLMGFPADEEVRHNNFQHWELVRPFELHEFPVTNEQYELFEPAHGDRRDEFSRDDEQPVIYVTFWDAWCFAKWCGCRLPTEVEWEYACRAGTTGPYNFDGKISAKVCNYGNQVGHTTPKGKYDPNGWDLYDMHGNVWEWCDSRYAPGGSNRVIRGGGWGDAAAGCRAAYRNGYTPSSAYNFFLGLRLARVPSEERAKSRKTR